MVDRSVTTSSLIACLLLASGCPEPQDDGGDPWGTETGESETGYEPPDGGDRGPAGDGDGDGGMDPGDDVKPPSDPGSGEQPPWDDPERCWDRTLNADSFPVVIHDNTIDRSDDLTASCGIGPAPDFQLGFMAPWAGSFTFDTTGSSFDTVLAIHPGECGEVELACNDDFIGLDSRVTIELEAFELITVSVDGTGVFEQGQLTLTISEAEEDACDAIKISPTLPKQIVGDTSVASDQLTGDCGGAGAPEQLFEFVAPGPGTYQFDTAGSEFDTVLYTLDGCGGAPLLCSDDVGLELHSRLTLELAGGQKQLLVVDGHDADDFGVFVLNVQKL